MALKLSAAKADGVRYGLVKGGKLIPETVLHGSVQIGRFEVTRAQFRGFDERSVIAQGQDNYPISGVNFDQAKAYCQWLDAKCERLPSPGL